MATQTTNYKLTKPEGTDKYNVEVFNGNADIIDTQLKTNATEIAKKQNIITGAVSTALDNNFANNKVIVTNGSGKIVVSQITDTELGYLAGTTSPVQTQLDAKLGKTETATKATADADGNTISTTYAKKSELNATVASLQEQIESGSVDITGAASTIVSSNLTPDRALVSNASGKVIVSDVTVTELNQLDGVTENIQTQLNTKQSKVVAGTGMAIASDGVTINHSNSVTAQTSYVGSSTAIPRIKYDAQGHITDVTTVTVYPPTSAGTSGQVWVSDGSGEGAWKTLITVSTVEPTSTDGSDGDIWFVYE